MLFRFSNSSLFVKSPVIKLKYSLFNINHIALIPIIKRD